MTDHDFAALLRSDVDPASQIPGGILERITRLERKAASLTESASRLSATEFPLPASAKSPKPGAERTRRPIREATIKPRDVVQLRESCTLSSAMSCSCARCLGA